MKIKIFFTKIKKTFFNVYFYSLNNLKKHLKNHFLQPKDFVFKLPVGDLKICFVYLVLFC